MLTGVPNCARTPPVARPVEPSPVRSSLSRTSTSRQPASARWYATLAPTTPPPMMQTSAVSAMPRHLSADAPARRRGRVRRAQTSGGLTISLRAAPEGCYHLHGLATPPGVRIETSPFRVETTKNHDSPENPTRGGDVARGRALAAQLARAVFRTGHGHPSARPRGLPQRRVDERAGFPVHV